MMKTIYLPLQPGESVLSLMLVGMPQKGKYWGEGVMILPPSQPE